MSSHDVNDRASWLQGPSAKCAAPAEHTGPAWRIVLLGPPGVGKGTQAALLSQRLGACHLSTGDLFRAARSSNENSLSPAMAAALDFMRQGHLVPDAIVWQMVLERVGCLRCQGGFVLDGFPRTLVQAESLKELLESEQLPLDAVLNYELAVPEIISRLSGRRTCESCKSIFHIATQRPRTYGTCDHCGGRLYQREDDRPESIAVRLEDYERSTAPLIQFYERVGLLTPVDAGGSPEEIFRHALAALTTRRNSERAGQQVLSS